MMPGVRANDEIITRLDGEVLHTFYSDEMGYFSRS